MHPPLHLTAHAVQRYRERVDPSASQTEARLALARLVSMARLRSTPRHWMRDDVSAGPGVTFAYWSAMPHVCALVCDGAVVTVLTRDLCRTSPRRHLRTVPARSQPAPRPALRLVDPEQEAA